MMKMIEIKALYKKYGKNKRQKVVLSNLNLTISEGALFSLLGENGAGKTTLIKILSTLVLPEGGQAFVDGHDVEKEPAKVRASIGLVTSDERSFFWRLNPAENLMFFAALQNIKGKNARSRVDYLIGLVGLKDSASQPFRNFSSGMKQRLTIARALLHDPPIILMDEPTKGVDPVKTIDLWQFIRKELVEKLGKTILLTTHDLKEAEELSDEVGILHRGELVYHVTKADGFSYQELKSRFLEVVQCEN